MTIFVIEEKKLKFLIFKVLLTKITKDTFTASIYNRGLQMP